MSDRQSLPHGLWTSPLDPVELAQAKRLRDVRWDSDGKTLVWLEGRGARGVLVSQRGDDAPRDLTTTLSVRAEVGYGGGDFSVDNGNAYFVASDGRLYKQPLSAGMHRVITPAFGHAASPTPSPSGRHIAYVHSAEGVDRLALVDAEGQTWPQILAQGADFYMQPCWHPKGRLLAWIEWDHPQMPWDGTRLVLATMGYRGDGTPYIRSQRIVAGGCDESISQPCFSPDGRSLVYASDRAGWSQLWCRNLDADTELRLTEERCDIATPAWIQGLRAFGFAPDGTLYFVRSERGGRRAYVLRPDVGAVEPVESLAQYDHVEQITPAPRGNHLACIASSPAVSARIVSSRANRARVHVRSGSESLSPDQLSQPQAVSWSGADGDTVYGLYYPPTSEQFVGTGKPPLVVNVHGGPTSSVEMGFEARAQYFATRGWAFLDLNYRGSTGHGRAYMEALRGNWGAADVDDALSAARYLCDADLADPDRMVLCGGSAGGYTVLRTLTAYPSSFRAGLCLYGISNLFSLAADTHKFEAHYLDSLLGPLPQSAPLYRERSPLFAADNIRDPIALFQGSEDRVVPPAQAEEIVTNLRRRGVPHAYHLYEGEGHGWRRGETIERFYRDVDSFLKEHVLFA